MKVRVLFFLFSLLWSTHSFAHVNSHSYIKLGMKKNHINFEWYISLKDLEKVIGLDINNDGKIIWREVKVKEKTISSLMSKYLDIKTGGKKCQKQDIELLIDTYYREAYAVLRTAFNCTSSAKDFSISYNFMFEFNPQHVVKIKFNKNKKMSLNFNKRYIRLNTGDLK